MAPNKIPVVTALLLAACFLAALLSKFGQQPEPIRGLFYSFYLEPRFLEIRHGQLWRLVTPIFVHFGILHLLMNAAVLWMFGRLMESVHGPMSYLSIICAIAVISNTAQYLVSGPLFGGLSGVLYGLLGLIWAMSKLSPRYPLRLNPKFTYFVIGWFVLCWSGLLSIAGIHIANTAHTAGLISGLAIAYLMTKVCISSADE